MPCRILPPDATVQSIDWSRPGATQGQAPQQRPAAPPEHQAPQPLPQNTSEQCRQQAYEQGLRDAEAQAAREGAARLDATLARLARTIDDLAVTRARALAEADNDIVQLSVAIARRILRRELTVDPDSLAGIVKAAIERIPAQEISRVRIHPDDAGCLQKHTRMEVCPDPSLERGSIVVETARGNLDASISTQLAEIERGLTDMLRRRTT
jgi:flagellar assembly protein FliH